MVKFRPIPDAKVFGRFKERKKLDADRAEDEEGVLNAAKAQKEGSSSEWKRE